MSFRSEVIRIMNEVLSGSKKITELTALPSNLGDDDLIEVVRSGENYKALGSQLPSGGGGSSTQKIVEEVSTPTYEFIAADSGKVKEFTVDCTANFPNGLPSTFFVDCYARDGVTTVSFTSDGPPTIESDVTSITEKQAASFFFSNEDPTVLIGIFGVGGGGGGAVDSVFGRTGVVVSVAGDYTASEVDNVPAGTIAATTVQGAINELDTDKQPIDSDLTTIAGLSPSNDDIIQRKAGAWANRTIAQLKTDLALITQVITNGVTTTAPSEDAVFDALALRLLLAGGTMSGNIAMGANKVTGLSAASSNGDAVRYEQLIEKLDKILGFNNQSASYTLVLGDAYKMVEIDNASANNVTVPANASVAYDVGTSILISQYGAGQTTIVPDTGVTIRSYSGRLKLSGRYAQAVLIKRGTNEWYLSGDITT